MTRTVEVQVLRRAHGQPVPHYSAPYFRATGSGGIGGRGGGGGVTLCAGGGRGGMEEAVEALRKSGFVGGMRAGSEARCRMRP